MTLGAPKRAKWIHERKLFLIQLLKDHDVPGFRPQNAWCKEAWNNIVRRLNEKFGTSYTIGQVKQKEQDLKKDYRSVKELVEQSGFGWNGERMMVEAPDSVWASFAARKNNESALHWRDKSFPYYDDLSKLYDGENFMCFYELFLIACKYIRVICVFLNMILQVVMLKEELVKVWIIMQTRRRKHRLLEDKQQL